MHWFGYDIGTVGKNTFIVTDQVNYLVYVEKNTPKYRVFYVLARKNLFCNNTRDLNCQC
jgi:hypothetical protein